MKNTIYYKTESEILDMLKDYGLKHEVFLTNSTTKVKCDDSTYIVSDRRLKYKDLAFLNKVKKYIQKTKKPMQHWTSKDIKYFQMYHNEGHYKDVVELDVNKAYWATANELGYISDEIYKEGLEVDKMVRLISFGSIATNKSHYDYDIENERYNFIKEEVNKITRSYFFDVAKHLDMKMQRIAKKVGRKNILFYWVDAFFVQKSCVPYMQFLAEQEGIELKTKPISSIKFNRVGSTVNVYALEKGETTEEKTDVQIKFFSYQMGNRNKRVVNETLDIVSRYAA